jgi:hypothetical protein
MVYMCYEVAFQSAKTRVGQRGVLGLELIMLHVFHEFDFQSARLRVG